MKRPKPGFGIFIRDRLRYPLKSSYELIYTDRSGIKHLDAGSMVTALLTMLYLMLCIVSVFNIRFTIFGWILWLLLPVLHHFVLRYFWTNFEVYEYESAPIRAEIFFRRKERRKNYSLLKKAACAIGALVMLIIAVGAFIITKYPPFFEYGDYTVLNTTPETTQQLYECVQDYVEKQCPGAELVKYNLSDENGVIIGNFFFRDPNHGVIIHSSKELMYIDVNNNNDYLFCYFMQIDKEFSEAKTIDFVPVPGDYPPEGGQSLPPLQG